MSYQKFISKIILVMVCLGLLFSSSALAAAQSKVAGPEKKAQQEHALKKQFADYNLFRLQKSQTDAAGKTVIKKEQLDRNSIQEILASKTMDATEEKPFIERSANFFAFLILVSVVGFFSFTRRGTEKKAKVRYLRAPHQPRTFHL